MNQRLHDSALEGDNRTSDKTILRSASGFYNLGIAPGLIKAINRLGFKNPTPIQKEAIPIGIQGKDILATARTGSGKTLAFGIPMLQRLSKMENGAGLVVVPTRELAIQVDESIHAISRGTDIKSAVLIGGVSMFYQREALKKNPRIIIATPGRLMDHVERRTVKLANIHIFILDEADRMLDMGFAPDIKKIIKSIPETRQTMLFSATMPKEIEAMAEKLMDNPTRIEIDRSGATPTEVSHELFMIKNQAKCRLLAVRLKECTGPVLVFTRTKRMASRLTAKVNSMGFEAAEIHSNRSLGQRRHALEGFKRGRYNILIATDIAARGIDVSGIELVVNYDMPANSEDYVHRIGRTGRAGKTGHAISFVTTEQRGSIRSLERFMKTELSFSIPPSLPSEKLLLKEAELLNLRNKPSVEEKPPKRKFSKKNPSKGSPSRGKPSRAKSAKPKPYHSKASDGNPSKGEPRKGKPAKRKHSKRNPSGAHASKRQNFKDSDSRESVIKQTDSKTKNFERKDSKVQESKGKSSKPQSSQSADRKPGDTKKKNPFWANFKKRRAAKKKSAGQSSMRKKRPKRK